MEQIKWERGMKFGSDNSSFNVYSKSTKIEEKNVVSYNNINNSGRKYKNRKHFIKPIPIKVKPCDLREKEVKLIDDLIRLLQLA